jgi:ABC-type lipoprotein export system ATPase subunit
MIVIENVSRRYIRGAELVTALDRVSLEINPSELTVLAGPSGSGKTTLLSVVAGYEGVDGGTVHTEGSVPPARLGWRRLAFVPQTVTLFDELTVAENVDLPARLDPSAPGRPTEELLDTLQIAHLAGRFPAETSGGEQQRAAVARALRLLPPLVLADEPTGHQDRDRVDLVLHVLRQHAYAGNTVLVSSHDRDVIAAADRVITLVDGSVASAR